MSKRELPQHKNSLEAIEFDSPLDQAASHDESPKPVARSHEALLLTGGDRWWQSQLYLMLVVFGLLILAALLFILITPPPKKVTNSTLVAATGDVTELAQPTANETDQTSNAPFAELVQAQARSRAQGILADLLEAKKSLELRDVESWAADDFAQAIVLAERGDAFYKQKSFVQAIQQYQAASIKLQQIETKLPEILAARTDAGFEAIREGKSELASRLFQEALKLDSNHIPALTGAERANKLDAVLEQIRSGLKQEQHFRETDEVSSLQQAQASFARALVLDEQNQAAQEGQARVQELELDKNYRRAMSQGFVALFDRRLNQARASFSQALDIRPQDKVASTAYQQTMASAKQQSLDALLSAAKRFEKSEQWRDAIENYQAVQQRDPNQVQAKLGLLRSQVRGELDQKIKSVLADPLALGRSTQRNRATQLLSDAKAIKSQGPRLREQIRQLTLSLEQADMPVTVQFVSDMLTEVSLKKAGAKKITLGKFNNKSLALKPGRYVLHGMRHGFQDVRTEVEVFAGNAQPQTISVMCQQSIEQSSVNMTQSGA